MRSFTRWMWARQVAGVGYRYILYIIYNIYGKRGKTIVTEKFHKTDVGQAGDRGSDIESGTKSLEALVHDLLLLQITCLVSASN